MVVAAAALFVSTLFAWTDLIFLLRSRSTEGTLVFAEAEPIGEDPCWKVAYQYQDLNGQEINKRTSLPLSWIPPQDRKLVIEYLPNDPSINRIQGIENHWALWFLGGSGLFLSIMVLKWFLEARTAVTMRAPRSWSPQQ